jgi:hypothetical protein
MEHTTVVLAPPGEAAEAVLQELVSWSAVGLVEPFAWTTASEWEGVDQGELVNPAAVVVVGGERQEGVLLLRHLAAATLDLVRLLVVQPLDEPEAARPLTPPARTVADYLREQLPAATTAMSVVSVLVPPSGPAPVDHGFLLPGSVNAVVAAEDRASDAHAATLVGADPRFAAHAALATATVGGLWVGVSGPFDDAAQEVVGGGQTAVPIVVRAYARLIEGEAVVDRLAERVLQSRTTWPLPSDPKAEFGASQDADGDVRRILDEIGTYRKGIFRYTPLDPPAMPRKQVWGVMRAFREMFRFIAQGLRDAPERLVAEVKEGALRRTEDFATRMTTGEGSAIVVRVGGRDRRDGHDRLPILTADQAADSAAGVLAALQRKPEVAAVPDVWETLRALSFALIDGSHMPDGFTAPGVMGYQGVVDQPAKIAPEPSRPTYTFAPSISQLVFGTEPGVVAIVPPTDAHRALAAAQRLRQELERLATEEARAAAAAPGPAMSESVDDEDAATNPDGDDERRATADDDDPDELVVTAEEVQEELKQLEARIEEQRQALLWQVAQRVAASLEKGIAALSDAVAAALEHPRPIGSAFGELRHALVRRWRRIAALGVLVVALAVAGGVLGWFVALVAVVIGLVGLLGWLFGWFWAYLKYRKALFRLVHQYDTERALYAHATEEAIHSAREVARLTDLYSQLVDWAEIVGWMVHHPWGRSLAFSDPMPGPGSLDATSLPSAMSIGRASTTDAQLNNLSARCVNRVFQRGWLTGLYGDLERREKERWAYEQACTPGDRQVDPDRDTPLMPTGARQLMLDLLRSGGAQNGNVEHTVATIEQFCVEQEPGDVFAVVEPLVVDEDMALARSEPLDTVLGRILPPTTTGPEPFAGRRFFSAQGRVDQDNRVVESIVSAPRALIDDAPAEAGAAKVSTTEIELQVALGQPYVLKAIRLDRSQALEADKLALFDGPAGTSQPKRRSNGRKPASPDDDDEVKV